VAVGRHLRTVGGGRFAQFTRQSRSCKTDVRLKAGSSPFADAARMPIRPLVIRFRRIHITSFLPELVSAEEVRGSETTLEIKA
jgi:hypothetical protein